MTCSVDGCEKKIDCHGLCGFHRYRLQKYGSATFVIPKRVRSTCTVAGCGRVMNGHGYCLMHYKRYMDHGSPTGGGITRGKNGNVKKFLSELLASETNDCVVWPFCKTKDGYGRINNGKKSIGAHVHVCTIVNGPRPDRYDACHSCGNGHLACVTPKHLRWGTRQDNVNDSIEHGTDNFFGRGPLNERMAA